MTGGRTLAPFTEREIERLGRLIDKSSDCWIWLGATWKGYGSFSLKRGGRWITAKAHRVSYEVNVGPIPSGLELDHLCRVRNCVNPAHLEPVTTRVNALRGFGATGRNARKQTCPRGHDLRGPGAVIRRRGEFGVECAICARERKRSRAVESSTGLHRCGQCGQRFSGLRFLRMHGVKVHGLRGLRDRTLDELACKPMSDAELARRLGTTRQSVSEYRRDLMVMGYITDSGRRGKSDTGSAAIVWQITPEGLERANQLRSTAA